jgi:hypothetical protein
MNIDDKFLKVTFAAITAGTPAEHRPESKGRNGSVKTLGVEIYTDTVHNLVRLSPITSRGDVSNACHLEVPFDRTVLEDLAKQFAYLATLAPAQS